MMSKRTSLSSGLVLLDRGVLQSTVAVDVSRVRRRVFFASVGYELHVGRLLFRWNNYCVRRVYLVRVLSSVVGAVLCYLPE